MTENEIEGLAGAMKRTLGLDQTKRVAMIQMLELMEEWLPDYIFTVQEDDAMPGMDGYTGLEHYEICLSNSTYLALHEGNPEARHTAAHELGHLLLHSQAPTAYARRSEYDRHVDPEWQADYFADAFLMPRAGVRTCVTAEEVAERYSVPLERAEQRFDEVTKIQGELF
ncbi:ImmA/IrrE family metallo-endopeptidase [Altererythrobacter sp. Z27]|uniref:ImmA/IrrE family metallo-endopeptidase n=1 Tax=Altererythrobacter sp. Z27 TaxID=3461147 RepID=UPI0040444E39